MKKPDVQTVRRNNLAALRKDYPLTEIAEKSGIDYTYLVRIQSKDRSFSERKARQIEKGLSLSFGYMDKDNKQVSVTLQSAIDELEHVPEPLLPAILAAIRALSNKQQ